MKNTFALAGALLAAHLLTAAAFAAEPKGDAPDAKAAESTATEGNAGDKEQAEQAEAKEDKRICRRIRADASSRRKTKLCLTTDEWRKYNNIK